ncbi:MAG: ABC transporter ATP-binding protein [Chlamydiae bacterium]|nr:ABC transporter ATP-binding protein [Chlamydiota bacterium]MBI3266094.1 ABC transporter ATP-binding protein [Chlamydiota bacterium]
MINIKNLTLSFPHPQKGFVNVVENLSLEISKNKILGWVGESGSGKTMTALSIAGLLKLKFPSARMKGQILYEGEDLASADEKKLRLLRGKKISMIFQNPFTFFNPSIKIGHQFKEISRGPSSPISEILKKVELYDPNRILKSYPYELSGGQLQRLAIAQAILHDPEIIIADEPTTALDASLKWGILTLLKKIKEEQGLTLVLISHDLASLPGICDEIALFDRGHLLKKTPAATFFEKTGTSLCPSS